jgi:hypothetical protein
MIWRLDRERHPSHCTGSGRTGSPRASSREVLRLRGLRFARSVEVEIETAGGDCDDQRPGPGSDPPES